MSIHRVAMVFDNTQRPETTGFYCRRALSQFVATEHILPSQLATTAWSAFDLVVRIDDGLDYSLPDTGCPVVYWAIDTHLEFQRTLTVAAASDLVFTAQRNGAEGFRQQGIDSALWLPLACDPLIHRPFEQVRKYDWSFVGHILPGLRAQRLQMLQSLERPRFVGQRYFEDMARVYAASKVVFNQSVNQDINMRVFETLGCGACLLTDEITGNGLEELFTDGQQLVTYASDEELLNKLDFYCRHDDLRQQIAIAGYTAALSEHTYLHRMHRLLETAEGFVSRTVVGINGLSNAGDDAELRGLANAHVETAVDTPQDKDTGSQVTAFLLSWQRPENLQQIVPALLAEPCVREVLIWNNNADAELQFADERVRLLRSEQGENLVTWGRFLAAREAKTDLIYTQDDDCLVHNLPELITCHNADPARIAFNLKLEHLVDATAALPGGPRGVLLGWGSVFRKEWVDKFEDYLSRYGADDLLHRKADRLFGPLVGTRHRPVPARITELSGIAGPEALSVRSDHTALHSQVLERLHELETTDNGVQPVIPEPEQVLTKDPAYFEFPRPELLIRIPATARRVLDVGCGAGALGQALKSRQNVEVTGIEREAAVAEIARTRLDHVLVGNVETLLLDDSGPFDAIVCGDVLEHLRDPLMVLRKLVAKLADDGVLIASLPNLRHHSVVASLLDGHFTYEPAGLLDEDHVRFFTRREIEKMFFRAGCRIEELAVNPGPGHREWVEAGRRGEVSLGRLQVSGLSSEEAEEFFAYQYLVTARADQKRDYGLTSIILLTHNELAYTQSCLQSLRLLTDEPYELIVVDNASTDGTTEWLAAQPDVRLIRNSENRGFPAAVNQGLAVAQGKQLLLLNNDTLLTTGWLRRMLDALYRDEQHGLVGPLSNNVGSQQQIDVHYQQLSGLDGFAWDLAAAHARQVVATHRLVGFCLLIRRAVLDDIGLLDERFGIGCYEDDDYCRRANAAGWKNVIALDAFVHHFGSRTFMGSGCDLSGLLNENRQKYEEKWQQTDPVADEAPSEPTTITTPQSDSDASPRLSLCLICRDNERTIRACVESIRPWVDEMVVVDTGSTDRTPQIAREYGARVLEFPWCDDFSAARNVSLEHARGEWLFWMDSDDTIDAENGRKLRELAHRQHAANTFGYVLQVHCPGPPNNGRQDVTAVDHVKLFRNRPELRFEHRIHEQILPAIRRAGGDVEFTDIFVVHSGNEHTAAARGKKLQRDFRILELDLAEHPEHPFVLFNLGMTCADAGRHEEAVDYLRRSIAAAGPHESHLPKAWSLLVGSLSELDCADDAMEACEAGLHDWPDDTELLFRRAVLHQQAGRNESAEKDYEQLIHQSPARRFSSQDRDLAGWKAKHNLELLRQ